jgi:phospholipid/cholesterol/gamma-HCH transport system ATP-binding protein
VSAALPLAPGPALRVRGLAIGWDDTPLVEGIEFDVARGEVFAILGGSGSGKSTLLRYLVGLERATTGAIDVAGHGPPDLSRGLPPYGVMFQEGALFGSLTVLENVALPLEEWTRLSQDAAHLIARSKLRLVGLADAATKLPDALSGGMVKRAAIARALALDPEIVFLDEPTAGLDPVSVAGIDELIRTLSRTGGITVVMVTHELQSVFQVADRCLLLGEGRVLALGEPNALRESPDPEVRRFFNPDLAREEGRWPPPPTR